MAVPGGEAAPSLALPESALATQRIFRVRYQGPGAGGGLRLVLRIAAAESFSLAASDTFGRAVWSLRFVDGTTTIADHRRQERCETGADVRVPEAALAPLPVDRIPLVLLGQLPFLADPSLEKIDVRDVAGRRWTAKLEGGRPASWTLWSVDRPSLWWLAQPKGGILSHPGGSQFRWREGPSEPLAGTELPDPPLDYVQVDCASWDI